MILACESTCMQWRTDALNARDARHRRDISDLRQKHSQLLIASDRNGMISSAISTTALRPPPTATNRHYISPEIHKRPFSYAAETSVLRRAPSPPFNARSLAFHLDQLGPLRLASRTLRSSPSRSLRAHQRQGLEAREGQESTGGGPANPGQGRRSLRLISNRSMASALESSVSSSVLHAA